MTTATGAVDLCVTELFHQGFRRDLDAFARAVRATPLTDRATWRRLADRWRLLTEVAHHHHTGEVEGLWPRLAERGDPVEQDALRGLARGARALTRDLDGCAELLGRMATHPDADVRAALVVRVTATRQALLEQLRREESEGFDILRRLLTPEQWRAVDDEHFRPALTPGYVLRLVPWAASGAGPATLGPVFAEAGPGFRWVWLLTRAGFARRERRTFRYA